MQIKDILDYLGISGPSMVAGFAGGIVNVFFNEKMKPKEILAAIIGGSIVAVYVGPPAAEITHLPIGLACFFLGFGAQGVVGQLMMYFRKQLPGGGPTNAAP